MFIRWGSCDVFGEAGEMLAPAEADAEMADTEETMPEADTPALPGCQLTTVSIINMRAGPGLEYEVLAEIPYQVTLSATAESNDWFKVEFMSQAGWVSREYVSAGAAAMSSARRARCCRRQRLNLPRRKRKRRRR